MAINQKPWLSPTMFEQLLGYAEFKADFHHVYIWARKDPDPKWFDLHYLAVDETFAKVIKNCPIDQNYTSDVAVGTRKSPQKKIKEVVRQKVQILAEKRKKEAEEKAQVEAERAAKEHAEQQEHNLERSHNYPSPQMEEEERSQQGSGDQQEITPFQVKQYREQEKEGPHKKTKATKSSLDPITLMEGNLDDIRD